MQSEHFTLSVGEQQTQNKYNFGLIRMVINMDGLLEGVRPPEIYVKRGLKKSKTEDCFFAQILLN